VTVVVLGDLNVDLEIELPSRPGEGEALTHPPARLTGGGSAANTAVALARLGVGTRFCGAVGNDGFGREAVQQLEAEGVSVDVAFVDEAPTVVVVVVVPADKERLIYVWPPEGGAHLLLSTDWATAALAGASWLHVSGISLRGEPARSAILGAMRAARGAGIPVSFDLNLRLENWGWGSAFRRTVADAVALSDVVLGGGRDEIGPAAELDDPEAAAVALAGDHRTVVARLGAGGLVACEHGRLIRLPAYPVEVVDTVGAGDVFNAGYIAAALDGCGAEDALRRGSAAAALSLTGAGARTAPGRDALERFLASMDRSA
jgi:sugar/nucleoside kinase (ribokinase family)